MISFTDTGEVVIGQEAVEILLSHPERSITGFKRLLGRNFSEIQDFVGEAHYKIIERDDIPAIEIPLNSGSMILNATETTALMIEHLKAMAEESLGQKVTKTAITVPSIFDDRHRVYVVLSPGILNVAANNI